MRRLHSQHGLLVFGHAALTAETKWELLDGHSRIFVGRRMETVLQHCTFEIIPEMLELSRQTQRPTVHGGVLGHWRDDLMKQFNELQPRMVQVGYHWQTQDYFHRVDTGEQVFQADWVILNKDGCWVVLDEITL